VRILQNFLQWAGWRRENYPADFQPSVVLLLHKPVFPLRTEVEKAAQCIHSNQGELEYLPGQRNRASHLIRCGSMLISIHGADQPYGEGIEEMLDVLQNAWDQHHAWLAIDLPHERNHALQKAGRLRESYALLLKLSDALWSENCTGVFFPSEAILLPNTGTLRSSMEWARRNGITLSPLPDLAEDDFPGQGA